MEFNWLMALVLVVLFPGRVGKVAGGIQYLPAWLVVYEYYATKIQTPFPEGTPGEKSVKKGGLETAFEVEAKAREREELS